MQEMYVFPCFLCFFPSTQEFKEFCPNEQVIKGTQCLDICAWDPSYSKTQVSPILMLKTFINPNAEITVNVELLFFPFRNTVQSLFAAQSARFLPNFTQATRITSAMCTGAFLRAKFCLTVRTALTQQASELWRCILKYSTSRDRPGRIMEVRRGLCYKTRTEQILT